MSVALRLALLASGLPALLGFVPSSVGHTPHVPVPPAISRAPVGHRRDGSTQAGAQRWSLDGGYALDEEEAALFALKNPVRYSLRPKKIKNVVDHFSTGLVADLARAREMNDSSTRAIMERALASLSEMNRSVASEEAPWEAFALAPNFLGLQSMQAIASVAYGPGHSVSVRAVVDRSNPPTGAGQELLRRIAAWGVANGYRVTIGGPFTYEGLSFQAADGGGFFVEPSQPARVPTNFTTFRFMMFSN